MIAKVGYDAESKVLRIKFLNNGKLVDYFDVPERIYKGLMEAKGKGIYMVNFVLNCYSFEYVNEEG